MTEGIESATTCYEGHSVRVREGSGPGYVALCDCYDGTEDSGAKSQILGRGRSPAEALDDWTEQHEEVAEVEFWPAAPGDLEWQVGVAAKQQADWVTVDGVYGPPAAEPARCGVCGLQLGAVAGPGIEPGTFTCLQCDEQPQAEPAPDEVSGHA